MEIDDLGNPSGPGEFSDLVPGVGVEAAFRRIRRIHRNVRIVTEAGPDPMCSRCREQWPCETIMALEALDNAAQAREGERDEP